MSDSQSRRKIERRDVLKLGSAAAAGFVALGIVVWSIGEMICSARFFEYCGTIAPPDQVAVYLGYSFFAIFIGNLYSGPWAGWLYEQFIRLPHEAGQQIHPWPFFAGVMAIASKPTSDQAGIERFMG